VNAYPECFGKQSPYTIWFNDGSKMVVWASSDELPALKNIEELGQKCLICKNDYICFETSRARDFCLGKAIRIA
jgi:hypothetical protein